MCGFLYVCVFICVVFYMCVCVYTHIGSPFLCDSKVMCISHYHRKRKKESMNYTYLTQIRASIALLLPTLVSYHVSFRSLS